MNQRDWERDVLHRQRNIVFPDTVLNEGRFYRNIASGRAIFTLGQKISLVAITCFLILLNAASFAVDLGGFFGNRFSEFDLWFLWPSLYSLLWLLFWIFLAVKALFPAEKPHKHRRGYRSSNR